MNKKYMTFGILGLFALALVSATLMSYYGQVETTINVEQPIVFTVNGAVVTGGQYAEVIDCDAGKTCLGVNPYRVTNNGESDKAVKLVDSGDTDEINVSYVGKVELSTKDMGTWEETSDKKATVVYTLVGEEFNTEVELDDGYVLVYAMDKDNRFVNFASVVLVGDVDGDLPYSSDWNADANPGYCNDDNGFDHYDHCKGAKLWIVKGSDLGTPVDDVYPLSWANMADYLYETDLIQYFDNADGDIVIPAESFIEFFPQFDVDSMAEGGEYTVTTTVDLA